MSKDIWHTAKEKPMLHRDIILCGNGWSMAIDIIPETVNNICWENVEKWGYLDELIKENDHTRKALDVAVDALKEIQDKGEYVNPIDIATSCLDEITAQEQKYHFANASKKVEQKDK